MLKLAVCAAILLAGACSAQDPAEGWLGYAKGVSPTGQGRITFIEAYWKVGQNPRRGGAFFSPWFGIESGDSLNLIQPVNPWAGNSWTIYNEYFQWRPEHNENSAQHTVQPGDILYGSVTFDPKQQAYTMYHKDMNDGWSVSTTIPVQKDVRGGYKNYTIAYFVFEKEWACDQYPPDGEVTFYNVKIQYDGATVAPKWTTAFVDDVCNNRAHVINETTIQITWNPNMEHTPQKSGAGRAHKLF